MLDVAVASSSQMSADAGVDLAARGGNAVDAAIGAAMVSLVTETVVASLGGGAFATVCTPEGSTVTIDGYAEMPGRGLDPGRLGRGVTEVFIDYGGGASTVIGPGSVAVPGTLAALDLTWRRHGSLPWSVLLEPARRLVEEGFPLTSSAHHYLLSSHDIIFGWHPEARRLVHDENGGSLAAGDLVRNPDLAESLSRIASEGADCFYRGELAHRIVTHLQQTEGILTAADLDAYRPAVRDSLTVPLDGWTVATNPPPAIGGAILAAMLHLMDGRPRGTEAPLPPSAPSRSPEALPTAAPRWSEDDLRRLVRVQEVVLRFRAAEIDSSRDPGRDAAKLLDVAALDELKAVVESPSTVHTSAVDSEGRACSISASTGYGSGVVAPGTGIFLNNCLGESELTPGGVGFWPVGSRLPSNMAPSVARRDDGSVLAIGSPGAARITTALLHSLLGFGRLGMSLEEAVASPRLHVEPAGSVSRVAYEPGLPVERILPEEMESRAFDGPSMFFGGVAGAVWTPDAGFSIASDPRRAGGVGLWREARRDRGQAKGKGGNEGAGRS